MVVVLVRMKLRVVAHSLRGWRAAPVLLGALAGLCAAAGTVVVAGPHAANPAVSVDVRAGVCLLWTIGWLLGPVLASGVNTLRSQHFAALPAAPGRLAGGLACASLVGVPPAVGLAVFGGAMFAAVDEIGPALVAVLATLLQLTLVVVLSGVVATAFVVRVPFRAPLLGLAGAGAVALVATVGPVLADGRSTELSNLVRALPSGWGPVAVDAAAASRWPLALACLLGLGALVVVSFAGWADLLARRTTARRPDTPAGVGLLPELPHRP